MCRGRVLKRLCTATEEALPALPRSTRLDLVLAFLRVDARLLISESWLTLLGHCCLRLSWMWHVVAIRGF